MGLELEPTPFKTEEERQEYKNLMEAAHKGNEFLRKFQNPVKIKYNEHDNLTIVEFGYLSTSVHPWEEQCSPLPINERNEEIVKKIKEIALSK